MPTVQKMLIAINEDETLPNIKRTTFLLVLKGLHFVFEKKSPQSFRKRRYLEKIKYYRAQNRPIYYLDETSVNAGETHCRTWVDRTVNSPRNAFLRNLTIGQKKPSGKDKRLIVQHVRSIDGFVPRGVLFFESKTNSADHHDEINGNSFFEWFNKLIMARK